MVKLAQLVRASDCGSEGRGFETHISPFQKKGLQMQSFLFLAEADAWFGSQISQPTHKYSLFNLLKSLENTSSC